MLTEQIGGEAPMREVVVYSTAGGEEVSIQTDATTWKELTEAFKENEISWKGMRVVEGNTEVTYFDPNITVRDDQKLPTEFDRLVFFMAPVKVKSGVDISTLPYWECRSLIHNLISTNEDASSHFNVDRNYTNKSTEELRALLTSWFNNASEVNCLAELSETASNAEKVAACITCLEEIEGTEDVISVLNSLDFSVEAADPAETPSRRNLAREFFANDPQVSLSGDHDYEEDWDDEDDDYYDEY